MTFAVFRALLTYWRKHPIQLATLLCGLAMATALWSGVQAINAEARASYASASSQVSGARFDRLIRRDGAQVKPETYTALRRAGWQVSPQIEGTLNDSTIIGLDPLTLPLANVIGMTPSGFDLPNFLRPGGLAVAHSDMAQVVKDLGLQLVNDDKLPSGQIIVDTLIAQKILNRGTGFDRLIVLKKQPKGRPNLQSIAPSLQRMTAPASSDVAQLTGSFHLNLTAFGLLSFAVGLFIVYGAIGLAFEQRRAMLRTIRALGVPLNQLMIMLAAELLVLALIGGALGVLMGYAVAAALLPDVAATLRGLYGAEVTGQLSIRPIWWLSGLGMAIGGTAIAGFGTFLRLRSMPLMQAGTPDAWAKTAQKMMRWTSLVGTGLILIAITLGFLATGLITGFAMLGAMMLGSALLLPKLLDTVLSIANGLARTPTAHWFWADTRQQVPGLSMALMALLLALAANIGVSTMVSSFRLTFTGWLDQRLAAELYITANTPDQAKRIKQALEPRVDAILPIVSAPITLSNRPGKIYGIADHHTYRAHWPLLEHKADIWSLIHQDGMALINEQLALGSGFRVGDIVPETGDTIVGIYSDYGNPAPQIIVGLDTFTARYPDVPALRFGLRLPPQNISALRAFLIDDLNVSSSAIVDQSKIKAMSLGIFEQTFTVTGALNVLTLSVAAFSILTSLLTLAQMRLPQLAPVWALGFTRAQLSKFEILRALLLAAFVSIFALPLGLLLAWVLLAVVNVAAFGWRLPMFLFPQSYAVLGLSAIFAALVAAIWPAIQLARIAPRALLQVFSNER